MTVSTRQLNEEYLALMPDGPKRAEEMRAARHYMEGSTAVMGGHVLNTSFLPKLLDEGSRRAMKAVAETMYGVFVKVIDAYRRDGDYRALFDFDERHERLIMLPCRDEALMPIARIDAFFNEDDGSMAFCEFNTDGASGMNENRETLASIRDTTAYERFARAHRVTDDNDRLFTGLVAQLTAFYLRDRDPAAGAPHFAVVDYLENAVVEEFKVYAPLFEAAGVRFSVYDIRDLVLTEDGLMSDCPLIGEAARPIDALWRRSVASDVLAHWDESGAFIEALETGRVELIGSFANSVVHDKRVFVVLRRPETLALLTAEERAVVERVIPFTDYLETGRVDMGQIKRERDRWIVKPTDMYGCIGVFAGRDFSAAEWDDVVERCRDGRTGKPYLVQEFCVPYGSPAWALRGSAGDCEAPPETMNNLSGLYLVGGCFAGVFSRLGPGPIILGKYGGLTAGTLWVDADWDEGTEAAGAGAGRTAPAAAGAGKDGVA